MKHRVTIPSAKKRIFIGIPVDRQARRQLHDLLESVEIPKPNVRWVAENNWHLTLAFLGNIPDSDVENLVGLFAKTYQQVTHFEFKLTHLARFPGSTGRIIALTGDPDGRLNCIFEITCNLLRELGLGFDWKEFRPHITLARIRDAKGLKTAFDQPANIKLKIGKITLYQSTLTETGSIYSVLKESHLGQ